MLDQEYYNNILYLDIYKSLSDHHRFQFDIILIILI
jgi:hypothetical protein